MTLCARLTVDGMMQHTGGVRETPKTVVNQVAVDTGAFKEIHQGAGVQRPLRQMLIEIEGKTLFQVSHSGGISIIHRTVRQRRKVSRKDCRLCIFRFGFQCREACNRQHADRKHRCHEQRSDLDKGVLCHCDYLLSDLGLCRGLRERSVC